MGSLAVPCLPWDGLLQKPPNCCATASWVGLHIGQSAMFARIMNVRHQIRQCSSEGKQQQEAQSVEARAQAASPPNNREEQAAGQGQLCTKQTTCAGWQQAMDWPSQARSTSPLPAPVSSLKMGRQLPCLSDGQNLVVQIDIAAGRHVPAPTRRIRHDAAPQRRPLLWAALVGRNRAVQGCKGKGFEGVHNQE